MIKYPRRSVRIEVAQLVSELICCCFDRKSSEVSALDDVEVEEEDKIPNVAVQINFSMTVLSASLTAAASVGGTPFDNQ